VKVPLKIAWRYLVSKKGHQAVNIISIVSICGVVVATAALVCVLSVFNGFRSVIMGRLAILDPQIAITATTGKVMANGDSVADAVSHINGVVLAMPVVEDQALAMYAQFQMPVHLKGVPDNYQALSAIDTVIVDGQWLLRDEVARYAVAAVGPALTLHVRPDYMGYLRIYAPQRQGHINLSDPMHAFRADSLFLAGIFQLQQNDYDADHIYVPLEVARDLFDYTSQATQVELKLTQGANEQAVMRQMQRQLGPNYLVKNRLMQHSEAYRLVNVEKWMAFLLLAFILIIATFNIISTLSLLIIEKDKSINTLQALGASKPLVTRVFVILSWLITGVGAITGIVLGVVLCVCQQHFGWIKLHGDASAMVVSAYPVEMQWSDVGVVLMLALAVGAITAVVTSLIMQRRLQATSGSATTSSE